MTDMELTTSSQSEQWTTGHTSHQIQTSSECVSHGIDLNGMDQPGKIVLVTVITIMAIIIAFGSIGNIFVIMAVFTQKKLRTTSNMFVVNLSACDLLFVSSVLPFNIYSYLINDWRLDTTLCSFVGFLGYTLTGTTILTITLIAWNRYKIVVDISTVKHLFSYQNMAIMLACAWIIPAISLQTAVFVQWGSFEYVPLLSTCNLAMDNASQSFKVFLLVTRAAIPSGLIIYFYAAIYATTLASHRRLQHTTDNTSNMRRRNTLRQENRLTRMMACIFAVFAVSYFPCTVSSVIDWNNMLDKTFHLFCQTSVFLGSAINPLIYGFMNERFRQAYFDIITCRIFRWRTKYMRGTIHPTGGSPSTTPSLKRASRKQKSTTKYTQRLQHKSEKAPENNIHVCNYLTSMTTGLSKINSLEGALDHEVKQGSV